MGSWSLALWWPFTVLSKRVPDITIYSGGKRPLARNMFSATFFNRNYLATFLSMNLIMGIAYFWYLWHATTQIDQTASISSIRIENRLKGLGFKGVVIFISLLILIIALMATTSRGGNLSTLAGLLLTVGLLYPRSSKKRWGISFLVSIALVISFGAYTIGDRLWERLKQEPFADVAVDERFSRAGMAKDTWALARDYPL